MGSGNIDVQTVVLLVGALVQAGIATERQIADAIAAHRGETLTDEQLNLIVETIMSDAERRKALAEADVEQAKADGAQ